ncbi:unnamed protein product [Adineta steineri]|uniref:Uncharacterized protein n=1 Tax=Adineta steineri TaxID=433720 RepID=A0A813R339_9BILA|nr:unnamed protein product [Adineta steineri]CAF0962988.1 unnamed protein product [Adineta steineri]
MSASLNGGDPRTYKKIEDNNDTSTNYQSQLNTNISSLNNTSAMNSVSFTSTTTTNIQQTNVSESANNHDDAS